MLQAVHLALQVWDSVGKLRLAVASAFASVLPNTKFSRLPINRLNGGVIWNTFLIRLYRKYQTCASVRGKENVGFYERQVNSVFRDFAESDADTSTLTPPCTYLSSSDWKAITDKFVPHQSFVSLPPQHAAIPQEIESLKLAFRFFVPLLIWAYNECKEWLLVTETLFMTPRSKADGPPTETYTQLDRASVYRYGSALDVRCHFKRTDKTFQSLTQVAGDAVKSAKKTAEELWIVRDLGKEHQALLKKFNIVKKCLTILLDVDLLDLLLTNDGAMSLFRRSRRAYSDSDTSHVDFLAVALARIRNKGLFRAGDEVSHERILIKVTNCLRDGDYRGDDLISTERQIDSFVSHGVHTLSGTPSTASAISLASDEGLCSDYDILRALLEELLPSTPGSGDDDSMAVAS